MNNDKCYVMVGSRMVPTENVIRVEIQNRKRVRLLLNDGDSVECVHPLLLYGREETIKLGGAMFCVESMTGDRADWRRYSLAEAV